MQLTYHNICTFLFNIYCTYLSITLYLKEQIGQESDYAGRMRDEKYEQELKVQKANQKIFELQRTNEQMGRLLSKIPPEVLEELQKNHKSRAKER